MFAACLRLVVPLMVAAVLAGTGGVAQAQAQDVAAPAASCPPPVRMPTEEDLQGGLARARDRGMLWRLHKDDRVSYLYGTVHLGRLDWAFPGPTVKAALAASDTIALELDVLDPAIAARLKAPVDAVVPTLPAALQERLARQTERACLPPDALARQHPVMQATMLGLLAARWAGLDPAFGQEVVLSGFGRAARKAVVSLETPEDQMRALLPDTEDEGLRRIEQSLQQLESGEGRRSAVRMVEAWQTGRLDDVSDPARLCDCTPDPRDVAFMVRVNDQRNPGLAAGIDALHSQGKSVFAAVGMLHMTGAQSLTRLLEARGYRVERVRWPG